MMMEIKMILIRYGWYDDDSGDRHFDCNNDNADRADGDIHCIPKKWCQNSNYYNYGTPYQNLLSS